MFGIGISALCYCFNEDFNIFYEWMDYKVNKKKIVYFLGLMVK